MEGPKSRTVVFQALLNGESPLPLTLEAFRNYLEQEHCQENLEFYEDCVTYQRRFEDFDLLRSRNEENSEVAVQARKSLDNLIATYVVAGAPKEINIDNTTRRNIIQSMESGNYHPDILKKAVSNTVDLMRSSCFPRFLTMTAQQASFAKLNQRRAPGTNFVRSTSIASMESAEIQVC